jgi:hypothetical protein
MGLLNPLNLLYLASLGALVIIYLRARSRPTIEVSSLMLFDEVPAPVASARVLRVDPMFWLETLALAALALAAAGFYLREPAAPVHVHRHARVFDLGAAMGAREAAGTRLDQVGRQAVASLAEAPGGDTFSVIGYALEARVIHAQSANRESIRAAIAALKPLAVGARASELSAALMRAREADTIDLYADRLPPGDEIGRAHVANRLRFHPIGAGADNLAIVSLDPGTVRGAPGNCVLRNFSPRPQLCQLAIDCAGTQILDTAVMLEPGGQAVVPFGPLDHGGLVSARIENDDALAADNQRWAYAPGAASQKVLLLSPDAGVRDDLARVLLAVNQNFVITALDPAKFKLADAPPDPSLVVMHDFYDPRIKAAARLLIYPPGTPEFPSSGTVATAELQNRAGAGDFVRPADLGPARVFAPAGWMEVLASGAPVGTAGAIPLAAFGRHQGGAVGLIAFDVRDHLLLDPDRLDALLLSVDLVKQLIEPADVQIVSTGSYAAVPAAASATITAPDGERHSANADRYGRIQFRALQAGRYVVKAAGRSASVYANYFDADESDLTAIAPAQLETARTPPAAALTAPGPAELEPLDSVFFVLALIAFLIESALILRNAAGWSWRHV